MPNDEIYALKDCFVKALDPLRVYLFGSYAYGTPTEDSDFDFYIVVDDSQTDTLELMARAYSACSEIKQHPVDILVGTNSKFESRKQRPTIESEVYNKGVLLYRRQRKHDILDPCHQEAGLEVSGLIPGLV